jgi:hypothetical protein
MRDVLVRKGLLTEEDIERLANEVAEKLKLKNMLDRDELEEVATTIRNYRPPSPTGWADALYLHSQRQDKERFSVERRYGATELRNLSSTLHSTGLRNEAIFQKLERAATLAVRYGIL